MSIFEVEECIFQYVNLLSHFPVTSAFFPIKITGPTPSPVPCDNSQCNGKHDGNFEYINPKTYEKNPHYFLQCSDGVASCQACWPSSLVFKEDCNQCLYTKHGKFLRYQLTSVLAIVFPVQISFGMIWGTVFLS